MRERDFIARIVNELGVPGTCNVGYNNIRFDDEFTRFTLFRNFHDAYEHEWRDGNSRWDLLDIVRLTRALRPDGIEWPVHPDGSPSNRLEDLTAANGLSHENAHDALSDVHATIAVARLIKQAQPRLFDYALSNRDKGSLSQLLNTREQKPVLHVSGMIPGLYGHTAVVVPIVRHPTNKNGVVVLDLREDPGILQELDAVAIARRIFTPTADLPSGETRLGFKTVHINRSPVVAPLGTLDDGAAERLSIDKQQSLLHCETVINMHGLAEKVSAALDSRSFGQADDVDASLYGGGFFSAADKQRFSQIRSASAIELAGMNEIFDDKRVEEMLFRYRARNYPESLQGDEQQRWADHCRESLSGGESPALTTFFEALNSADWPAEQQTLKQDLLAYADGLVKKWSIELSD